MEVLSDRENVKRFVSGDRSAFNAIAEQWQNRLYILAYRYLGNEQDAKDICQNTLVRVFKNVKKLENNESFSGWIYKIAVNLCKDELKKRRKRMNVFGSGSDNNTVLESYTAPDSEHDNNIIKRNIQEIVKNAVNSLPEEQKTVVILKEYQYLKFREISEILNIPENTVKSRMYYALKNIRKNLENQNLDKEVF